MSNICNRPRIKPVMNIMANSILKKLESKEIKTDEELETVDMIKNGRSFASTENLAPVLGWLKQASS